VTPEEQFIAKSLVRPLTVVSDGLHCFMALEGAGVHERVITGSGKASVKLAQFQAVDATPCRACCDHQSQPWEAVCKGKCWSLIFHGR
jgi:hypothetical protein